MSSALLGVFQNNHIQGAARAGTGLSLAGNSDVVVDGNTIESTNKAIWIFSGSTHTLTTNVLTDNTYGIYIDRGGSNPQPATPEIVNGNQIIGNDYGIYVQSYGTNSAFNDHRPRVNGNQIHSSAVYNYHADGFPQTTVLDATGNDWGSDNPGTIVAGISSQQVLYSPFLNSMGELVYVGGLGPVLDADRRIESGTTQVLTGNLIVPIGKTLTLGSGSRLEVPPGKTIVVNGTLTIETGDTPPVLTVAGTAGQYWQGLVINSTGQLIQDLVIEHVVNGIEVLETHATIRDVVFNDCSYACIYGRGRYDSGQTVWADVFIERVHANLMGVGRGAFFYATRGTLNGSEFSGGAVGVEFAGNTTISARYNSFTGNARGVYVHSSGSGIYRFDPAPIFSYNNLVGNSEYAFYSEPLAVSPGRLISGTANWWGTNNLSAIQAMIWDANDGDSRRANLLYEPVGDRAIPLPLTRLSGAGELVSGPGYEVTGTGVPNALARVYVDGSAQGDFATDSTGVFTATVPVSQGQHVLHAVSLVDSVESYKSRDLLITVDDITPTITITEPSDGLLTNRSVWSFTGQLSEPATLTYNGESVVLAADLSFTHGPVALSEGINNLNFTATDAAGNTTVKSLTITVDTSAPAALDSARIVQSPLNADQTTVTGNSGAAEPGARITLVNARSGTLVDTEVQTDGGFVLTLDAQPGDTLFLFSTDMLGNQTARQKLIVAGTAPALSVQIQQPTSGATIAANVTNVQGTYNGPRNVRIDVNGTPALLAGDQFYVDALPLEAGTQALVATIQTLEDVSETTSIDVTSAGTAIPIVNLNTARGVGDQDVSFSVIAPPNIEIAVINMDFNNDGVIDYSGPPDALPEYGYTSPGLHIATGTMTTPGGQAYNFSRRVSIASVAAVDAGIRANWQEMAERLTAGDVTGGVAFLTAAARARFEPVFTAQVNQLPSIVTELSNVAGFSVSDDIASFTILRTENGRSLAFKIYLLRGADGLWRIDEM
jgi:hypothetical protein